MIKQIVVLIDGENISHRHYPIIKSHLNGITKTIDCRVYGDWSRSQLHGWKDIVIREGFKPVHQFNARKNTTDFELVMDAMELLLTRQDLNTFCVVSSDSDFSNLCIRLKAAGKNVVAIGESKTPLAYRNSCSSFIELGNLTSKEKNKDYFKTVNTKPKRLSLRQKQSNSRVSPLARCNKDTEAFTLKKIEMN